MIIKQAGLESTTLSQFDLLSKNEVGLSSAFAYLLGKEQKILYSFLRFLGLDLRKISNNFDDVAILKENVNEEGRTDIEIIIKNELYIIIECKVNNNKLGKQREQYLKFLKQQKEKIKIQCFITQYRGSSIIKTEDIKTINADWKNIIEYFINNNKNELRKNSLLKDFINFATKNFKVTMKNEILIQDLKFEDEISRFLNYQIYRRTEFGGYPLYFAPYFTRNSSHTEGEGIFYLSKILGVFTFCPKNVEEIRIDLEGISIENVEKWIEGVKAFYKQDVDETELTYYFLDKPIKFSAPLLKVQKENSKGWIAGMIPKNRTVSFTDFISHIPDIKISDE